jgi:hypothetical protein
VRSPSRLLSALLLAACSSPQARTDRGPGAAALLDEGQLDGLIEASWRHAGVTPSPPADDLEFLRRVTLDLVGHVPSLGAVKVFLLDRRPDKRVREVDRLLASPEFGEHWADRYANLLWHEQAKRSDRQDDPRAWLAQAFNENAGYDRISGVILAGRGDVRQHGGLAFIEERLRAAGPEGLAGSVARVFLGLNIQCAQCHDHPYDPRWKQADFWGLVAYFAGVRVRQDERMGGGKSLVIYDEPGVAMMPVTGSNEGVMVKPRFLGYWPRERPTEGLRRTFQRATVDSDLFPKAMVARTWSQLFGHGLVEPWDDLGGENDPRHPELLVKLAADFRAAGFNVKRLIRQMVLSTAYARSSAPPRGAADDPPRAEVAVRAFARAGIRALTPEQLFRSVVVMTGAEMKAIRDREQVRRQLTQRLREYRFAFEDDEMGESTSFDGSVPQALLLLNGELTNDGARVGPEGVLGAILRLRPDPPSRLDDMMLAAYARPATAEEKTTLLEGLSAGSEDRQGWEDLFFALVTSTEALTNH